MGSSIPMCKQISCKVISTTENKLNCIVFLLETKTSGQLFNKIDNRVIKRKFNDQLFNNRL